MLIFRRVRDEMGNVDEMSFRIETQRREPGTLNLAAGQQNV
jgi:hypothetical protein